MHQKTKQKTHDFRLNLVSRITQVVCWLQSALVFILDWDPDGVRKNLCPSRKTTFYLTWYLYILYFYFLLIYFFWIKEGKGARHFIDCFFQTIPLIFSISQPKSMSVVSLVTIDLLLLSFDDSVLQLGGWPSLRREINQSIRTHQPKLKASTDLKASNCGTTYWAVTRRPERRGQQSMKQNKSMYSKCGRLGEEGGNRSRGINKEDVMERPNK